MNNMEIRNLIKSRRLRFYEVAKELGINEGTFSRWMRYELPEEKKAKVIRAINSIK